MDDIYSRIKIIPTASCLVHEGIVQKWVDEIASNIKNDGLMKNPIIVTRHLQHYIVLDGMHRFAALCQLGIRDILACEVDYLSDPIVLEGWDAFVFQKLEAEKFLKELFPEKKGFQIDCGKNFLQSKSRVLARELLLAVGQRHGGIFEVRRPVAGASAAAALDILCGAVDSLDRVLSERFSRVVYVDNSQTLDKFEGAGAETVVFRPQFSKKEVLDRTLHKKIFPPKSTRHLIPERPLHVDLDLSLLRADIDPKTKNKFLQDHLKWCYENNRVRFYPESVYVFAD